MRICREMMSNTNKILPIGVQNFESLIRDGYVYVDKTEQIWRLTHFGRHYFLARPRRFGKSLLLSTIEAYFEGKKELLMVFISIMRKKNGYIILSSILI